MLLKSIFVLTFHCACALRLPETIYITTESSIEDASDLKTELSAPQPHHVSQFYQEQPIYFQQQPHHLSPFLFSGPVIHLAVPLKPQQIDESSENHENSYKLYRPSPAENPQFVDMLPPSEVQDEPNYYMEKPRKNKKYSEAAEKKPLKKTSNNLKEKFAKIKAEPSSEPTSEPSNQKSKTEEIKNSETEDESLESAPSSRLDFSMHGHKGPDSYKFGYDTGTGKNRMYKIEEKDEKGDVYGKYAYTDDEGKFRVVKYESKKDGGFKIL